MVVKKELPDFLSFLVGACLVALSIVFISLPHKLVSGGTPGYGLVISYLTNLPVGTTNFIFNTTILVISFFFGSVTIGVKSIIGYTIFSYLLNFFKSIFNLPQSITSSFSSNAAFNALQALVAAPGVALIMTRGYSVGAFGTLIFVVQKYWKIHTANFFFFNRFYSYRFNYYFLWLSKGAISSY